ncbi:tetratricopeptide repeat protein, partial [Escherichia coli]|nr:tetratricopeptide repeat protein [Escherichia coli]
NVYYEQKLYTQALPYYAEAARLDPKWALPRVYQGDTYRLLKNYPEAKSWYLQALKIDPKDEDANYWLGLLYVVEGDLVSA